MFHIRSNAAKWKIDPKRIGVMGFSAGGHLVSTLINRPEDGIIAGRDYNISPRPDLAILCYPVISMITKPHATSRKMLISDSPDEKLVRQTSSELQVKPGVRPSFSGTRWRTKWFPWSMRSSTPPLCMPMACLMNFIFTNTATMERA